MVKIVQKTVEWVFIIQAALLEMGWKTGILRAIEEVKNRNLVWECAYIGEVTSAGWDTLVFIILVNGAGPRIGIFRRGSASLIRFD